MIIIRNGTVIDGSGKPGFRADVVIEDDRISTVGRGIDIGEKNGCEVVDAQGKVVCPGFIDPHSHADMTISRADHAELLEPLVRQGITTFIGGNCGMSMAPVSDSHHDAMMMYLEGYTTRELGDEIAWTDSAGFMDHLDKNGVCMNTALLAPHGLIRIDAMGMEARTANKDELAHMSRLLDESMDAGCIGMSTGLQYMPGLQSDTRELVELGKILKKHDGIYASHLRTYFKELPRAVDELVAVARKNDIRAQVSHIIAVSDFGVLNPVVQSVAKFFCDISKFFVLPMKLDADIEKQLDRIAKLRRKGVSVGVDVMPTTTTFTHLMAYLPPWVLNSSKEELLENAKTKKFRRKVLRDIRFGRMAWPHTGRRDWSLNLFKLLGWNTTIIMSVVSEKNKPLEGRRIADVAREQGKHPFDMVCDLLVEEEGRVLVFASLGDPDDAFFEQSQFAPLTDPDVSISTDTMLMGFGKPSHLFYGAYPRFISRYVNEKKMLDMETAVRKSTGLPSEHFGIKQRGFIKENYFADVVVFDPKTIAPNCDFNNPRGTPSGIEHVFINGHHALDSGEVNMDPLPGRVLRHNAAGA